MAEKPSPGQRLASAALNSTSSNTRRTNPSPLQTSTIPTPVTNQFGMSSSQESGSLYNRSGSSPRSPAFQRIEVVSPGKNGEDSRSSALAIPRGTIQQRAVSGPASTSAFSDSPPPPDTIIPRNRTDLRSAERLALRTSSIDSTMSTNSSATSAQDPLSPHHTDVQQLIMSSGSAEAVIRALLKEKQTAAQQNAQLWRLINKQRHLIMGLNSDLAKAAEDRERYQKRCQELINAAKLHPPSQQIQQLRRSSMSVNSSPARSEDDLPIQRHSMLTPNLEHRRSVSVGAEAKTSLRELQGIGFAPSESIASSSETSPSFSSVSKPRATPDSEGSENEFDSRRNTIMQTNYKPIAPLEIKKIMPSIPNVSIPSQPPSMPLPIPGQGDTSATPSSFSARRSFAAGKPGLTSPIVGTPEAEPITSPLRKGPPARLNLQQKQTSQIVQSPKSARRAPDIEDHSDSDYDMEIDELPAFERGRKKTRAEDDREREYIITKQEESRSQSKQEKRSKSGSKPGSKTTTTPLASPETFAGLNKSPVIQALAPTGSTSGPGSFSPPVSLDGLLSVNSARSPGEQSVNLMAPPLSPGLPKSPRPGDRPTNAPQPRAPNDVLAPPLSMRTALSPASSSPSLPRSGHQTSVPPTPTSLSSPRGTRSDTASTLSSQRSPALSSPGAPPVRPTTPLHSPNFMTSNSPRAALQSPAKVSPQDAAKSTQESIKSDPREAVNLPVPGNLQRIPSDTSSLSVSGGIYRGLVSDSYPDLLLAPNALPSITVKVTSSRLRPSRNSILSLKSMEEEPVFTLGITARSNAKQLWRVEKPILALPQLDQQIKSACAIEVRLPDRNLFTGHAPSKIDARRDALEKYFEDILDTPLNEQAALILCQFLSAQAIPAEEFDSGMKAGGGLEGQNPVHLGPDGKVVKEGFLTKRGKNFGGWKARYFVLDEPTFRYYESPGGSLLGQIKLTNAQIGRQSAQSAAAAHSPSRNGEESEKEFRHAFLILEPKKKDSSSMLRHVLCAENDTERDEWVHALLQYIGQPVQEARPKSSRRMLQSMMKNDASREDLNALQGVSYEDTVAGQPIRSGPPLPSNTASPVLAAFQLSQLNQQQQQQQQQQQPPPPSAKLISGPTGGAVIQDAMAWGNKAPDSPKSRDKDKKRSIWGFRDRFDSASQSSGSSGPPPRMVLPPGSKPVFGMPLVEAVETYPIRGAEINLPSVVFRCLEYLESKDAASEEGIFRLSGSNLTIKALKDRFNNEGDLDFLAEETYYDVHAIASLLKMYLRELPGSVLGPRELHMQFQAVLELEDRDQKIAAYNVLVHRLPPANWTLIRSLSAFLIGIVNNSNVNKMTVRNVGIVFSPTLNIPSPLFAAFLTDFDKIFTADPPTITALSPVMEDPEPGTQRHQRHVLQDSRPPQSRDSSAARRKSRSRTRSRTPDRPAQGLAISHARNLSAEELRNAAPQYPPPPPGQFQQQQQPSNPFSTQHIRQFSGENVQGYVAMVRQPSGEGHPQSLMSSNVRSKRESVVPPGLASTNIMRDAKARRRESSMQMAGMGTSNHNNGGPSGGPAMAADLRRPSLPQLKERSGMDDR